MHNDLVCATCRNPFFFCSHILIWLFIHCFALSVLFTFALKALQLNHDQDNGPKETINEHHHDGASLLIKVP